MDFTQKLLSLTDDLRKACNELVFTFDGYVYNPVDYAWDCHKAFLERYVRKDAKALMLGMNPGPFGMMQTGVPFGEINAVLSFLDIHEKVSRPAVEHPARPVLGLGINRSEKSGERLWALMKDHYKSPVEFSKEIALFNYCPLGFLMNTKTAKNETPDHLAKEERQALEKVCNTYLTAVLDLIRPSYLIGVGKYAEKKLIEVNNDESAVIFSIIHPSPGNPQANRGWAEKTETRLKEMGLWN